jgi:hypothetical protein
LRAIGRKDGRFRGRGPGAETAAIGWAILAKAKRSQISMCSYVNALRIAVSPDPVERESLLPEVGIAAHPEHVLEDHRDQAEGAAHARRRRRASCREKALWCESSMPKYGAR